MDRPGLWMNKSLNEILHYRLSLVRGKQFVDVRSATNPCRFLSTYQEAIMASKPTDMEMWLKKKPRLSVTFSSREAPSGPSAFIRDAVLTENPKIPKMVDYVVSDIDLRATEGILKLYYSDISQRQITRILSVGLLGLKKKRRLVPTEWSITAIDDILGKALHQKILKYPWINNFLVFGHKIFGNNIQILLFPSSWMFEAQEAWITLSNANGNIGIDYEYANGRSSYASDLCGAYYAVRLPILEYLEKIGRQAGALVLMEVYPEWIPLGVWRFREICREALQEKPIVLNSLELSLLELKKRLRIPIKRWLQQDKIIRIFKAQEKLTSFL
jgi:hypothetical protein